MDFRQYESVSASEIAAQRGSPASIPLSAATPPGASADGEAPVRSVSNFRVVGGPVRSQAVPLTYPIANAEVVIETIVVRRMSVAEVRDFMRSAADDETMHIPMFEMPDGRPVPPGALDALDHDDWARLDRVALDFLPLALRGALGSDLALPTGAGSPA